MKRLFALVLAALSWFGVGEAQAACTAGAGTQVAVCADRQEAYWAAEARLNWVVTNVAGKLPCPILLHDYPAYNPPRYQVNAKTGEFGTCGNQGRREWPAGQDCPAGKTWNDVTHMCEAPNQCAQAPNVFNLAVRGGTTACNAGCEYEMKLSPEKNPADVCMGSLAAKYCGAQEWQPTGNQCGAEDKPPFEHDPNKDTCGEIPGSQYQECVKSDGTHCITTPTGRRLCWGPNETGPRSTSDGKDGADRQKAPGIPTAPTNIANPTPGPSTTTTINNNTYNTNTYSGTGNTGPNQGGNTGVDGDEDGDGEGDDPNGEPGEIGELYQGDGDKTAEDVFAVFQARVMAAPIGSAAVNFMTVSVSGNCPVWSVPATDWWGTLTLDFHCSGVMQDAFMAGGWLLLAVAAFCAFRIGMY